LTAPVTRRLVPWMARPEAATPGRTGTAGDELVLFDFAEGSPAGPDRYSSPRHQTHQDPSFF